MSTSYDEVSGGDDGGSKTKAIPIRPQLGKDMRSSSFLREHQQYRPPTHSESHLGIDTVVEDIDVPHSSPGRNFAYKGIPSEDTPPTIVEGPDHSLSHPNCVAHPGPPRSRLIATLFYKGPPPRHDVECPSASTVSGSPPKRPSPLDSSTKPIPDNLAPTTDLKNFPLEPPTEETEQLDHLYGSYISPLCITSFLYLLSTFPQPPGTPEMQSSHRCLDHIHHPRVVEMTVSPAPSPSYLSLAELRKHEQIYKFEREWNVDVILQMDTPWRRHPRLVVFDMDSTLITQEVIDLLAETITDPPDLAARVADITHRAMMGELQFESAFRERVNLLKGLSASIFTDLRPVLDVTRGVRETIRALKRLGVKVAVLSGGFLPLTSWLASELGIDYAHANEVIIDEKTNKLTGEVKGIIVGKERKRDLLLEIAAKEGIDLSQVLAVGDGANDLLMMAVAGLGVAWNAKPKVQLEAAARLNGDSMLDLLYLFGFTSEEVQMLIS